MRNFFFPVIHHLDCETSLRNAEIASECGADGVFLISMDGHDHLLDKPAVKIRKDLPDLLVGTNRLSMPPEAAIARDVSLGLDCSWADHCGLHAGARDSQADRIEQALAIADVPEKPSFRFFASIAFKYRTPDPDAPASARAAIKSGWVPVTSGTATGSAPDLRKIKAMREAVGIFRHLGIASGMTPENVGTFLPYANVFLVSTGISLDFHRLDPAKARAFAEALR